MRYQVIFRICTRVSKEVEMLFVCVEGQESRWSKRGYGKILGDPLCCQIFPLPSPSPSDPQIFIVANFVVTWDCAWEEDLGGGGEYITNNIRTYRCWVMTMASCSWASCSHRRIPSSSRPRYTTPS